MSREAPPASIGDLGSDLPIFPLTGVLLLPRGILPLNIFEPRYLAMTRDALAGNRLIGMVQPAPAKDRRPQPETYRVGCAGHIATAADTDDGRILITLRGVCRFRIVAEEDVPTPYRRVTADFEPYAADLAEPSDTFPERQRLLKALRGYTERRGIPADWPAIDAAPAESLVHSLAMICPFTPGEKQALLEAEDLPARAALLTAILEMALLEPPNRQVSQRPN